MDRAQTLAKVERIRELLKTHGVNETARIVDCCPNYVSLVKNGKRPNWRQAGQKQRRYLISGLKLKHSKGKLCVGCGNPMRLVTKSLRCVECELLHMEREGMILITSVDSEVVHQVSGGSESNGSRPLSN